MVINLFTADSGFWNESLDINLKKETFFELK